MWIIIIFVINILKINILKIGSFKKQAPWQESVQQSYPLGSLDIQNRLGEYALRELHRWIRRGLLGRRYSIKYNGQIFWHSVYIFDSGVKKTGLPVHGKLGTFSSSELFHFLYSSEGLFLRGHALVVHWFYLNLNLSP